MYIFALVSMPLTFLTLKSFCSREDGVNTGLFARGLIFAVPSLVVWAFLAPKPAWGSALLVLCFFVGYFLIPFGSAALIYILIGGLSGRGEASSYGRHAAFIFGFMTLFAIVWTTSMWSEPNPLFALLVPSILLASTAVFPVILIGVYADSPIKYGIIGFGMAVFASIAMALCFMSLYWIGLGLSAVYIALSFLLVVLHIVRGIR